MRITYFNYLWDIDGISAGSAIKGKELIRALNKLGNSASIHWRTPQPNYNKIVSDKHNLKLKMNLSKYLHGPKKNALNFKHFFEEKNIVNMEKPDVLFSRLELFSISAVSIAKLYNIPFVLEVDCPPVWEYKHFAGKNHVHIPFIPEYIERINIKNADAIIVISKILRNYLIQIGANPEKLYVVPNGADPMKFRPYPPDSELLARYKIKNKIVMGWVGALHGWSGLEDLINVAKEIMIKRSDVYFMFITGGKNKMLIEKEFFNHPARKRVLLPGKITHEHVPRFLSLMDVVFVPYPKREFWYPSSMKLFEYMSAGKAVVATNVGQIEEIIKDGENGIFFDPANPKKLISKLIHLIDDTNFRTRLGYAARESVKKYYTWEKHARKLEDIFTEIIDRKKFRK